MNLLVLNIDHFIEGLSTKQC